ncbi:MAG: redoxin domain-containing protein [Chloroflexi bacterium]|nr:redoxin domain-containing protein [Chloroflexota bacterium]
MFRLWILILLLFGLTACSSAPQTAMPSSASLPDLGPAPELTNSVWLNTDKPLRLADLRGKVVGLEMWTFACINCQHVIPSLRRWYATYKDQGFIIIGNHYPEFSYEADLKNLKDAITEQAIKYPVAQDNDGETWNAYHNIYWPSLYLIDKRGHIRYVHFGEGAYDEIEANIKTLLAESYP